MDAVGYLLKSAQQSLRAAMDAALRDLGSTTPQYAVLAFLEEAPGLSGAQLARRAFVTPQTMNRILANLEAAGLIARSAHPDVGRVLEATLTERGRALLVGCHRRVHEVEARMVAGFTEPDCQLLADLLQRCSRNLRPPRRFASPRRGAERSNRPAVAPGP
jgi:DNA-binding MarR family transcriptional regulator